MKIETVMASILINAYKVGKQNAGSIADKNVKKTYVVAWEAALRQVSLDLGMAFKRMSPGIKKMEVY